MNQSDRAQLAFALYRAQNRYKEAIARRRHDCGDEACLDLDLATKELKAAREVEAWAAEEEIGS